jgi:RNA-directed DNA polymerase
MRDYIRATEPGQTKTWVLQGQNSRSWHGTVALRRLITSRKIQFRWHTPLKNLYILRDEKRSTIESRHDDVAFAISNA